jgi:DNA-binding beta-propeller fold protein YncE
MNTQRTKRVKPLQEPLLVSKTLVIWLVLCASLYAQRPPSPTALGGNPFFITKTWVIGGVGDWDYMAIDPVARQLFVAHGPAVQVVDVSTGTLTGTMSGIREAHAIVLDRDGALGYVTDGLANNVKVFDRRTMQVVARIPTGPAPRAAALESQTKLLFVIGSQPLQVQDNATGTRSRDGFTQRTSQMKLVSVVTVIDTDAKKELAQISLSGSLGFAQADRDGRVYITVSDRNQIMALDAQAISSKLRDLANMPRQPRSRPTPDRTSDGALLLDWTSDAQPAPEAVLRPRTLPLAGDCRDPRALAVDSTHGRLFAACANMRMAVLNSDTGQAVASLPLGAEPGGLAYDANRGLIFAANGGGDGSLTIIRQDVTDSYNVVQILPTRQRARTLALNASSGEVYLAAVIYGATLNRPPVTGAPLKISAVDSSFQVLVVGN